jgi:hypothetical protein
MLGVSFNTLRRRIDAGQVQAERVRRPQGHVWRVYLDADHRSDQRAEQDATQDAASTLPQPPDVLRAGAMATYTRSLLEPLVNRLAEQERTIRGQAEELGRLRERVTTLEAPNPHESAISSNLGPIEPDPRGATGTPFARSDRAHAQRGRSGAVVAPMGGLVLMVSLLKMIVLRAVARTPARWRRGEPALVIRDEPPHTGRVRGDAYAAKPDHPVPALPSG